MKFDCAAGAFPVHIGKDMRVLRFLFLAWMGVRTFAQPAPLLYELTNQQQIPGDQIVSLTPQGVRFRIQFQPTDVIPWGALTTNSVQHILGRLQREPVYLQLQPALQAGGGEDAGADFLDGQLGGVQVGNIELVVERLQGAHFHIALAR